MGKAKSNHKKVQKYMRERIEKFGIGKTSYKVRKDKSIFKNKTRENKVDGIDMMMQNLLNK